MATGAVLANDTGDFTSPGKFRSDYVVRPRGGERTHRKNDDAPQTHEINPQPALACVQDA